MRSYLKTIQPFSHWPVWIWNVTDSSGRAFNCLFFDSLFWFMVQFARYPLWSYRQFYYLKELSKTSTFTSAKKKYPTDRKMNIIFYLFFFFKITNSFPFYSALFVSTNVERSYEWIEDQTHPDSSTYQLTHT